MTVFVPFPPTFNVSPEIEKLERLGRLLPSHPTSNVNDRTILVWKLHYVGRLEVRRIADELGWCIPAVEWHLKRANRTLAESFTS